MRAFVILVLRVFFLSVIQLASFIQSSLAAWPELNPKGRRGRAWTHLFQVARAFTQCPPNQRQQRDIKAIWGRAPDFAMIGFILRGPVRQKKKSRPMVDFSFIIENAEENVCRPLQLK